MNICVLRSGGEYKPQHVKWLARQVPDLVCLTDIDVPGVPCLPLKYGWPGWWSKMELFRPDLPGDLMYFDLDTVVFRVPEANQTTVLQDFYHPELVGSGLMYLVEKDRHKVWEDWIKNPEQHMKDNSRWPNHGDQGFIGKHLNSANRWGREVVSYKKHCRTGVPQKAQVVCFHGKPRPWAAKENWIPPAHFCELSTMAGYFAGKTVLIMGGGPSLEDDLEQAGDFDAVISANGHGADLIEPDYVVAVDSNHGVTKEPMQSYLRGITNAPAISPEKYADIVIKQWPGMPRRMYSGITAIYVAGKMGAERIVLAGMDNYDGQKKAKEQLDRVLAAIGSSVRAISGPLADYFGDSPVNSLVDEGPVPVIVRKTVDIGGIKRRRGEELFLPRSEADKLAAERSVLML